jgi:hypothetical protein
MRALWWGSFTGDRGNCWCRISVRGGRAHHASIKAANECNERGVVSQGE